MESIKHKTVQFLTEKLPLAGIGLPMPPGIIPAAWHPKNLTLCADAIFTCIVRHVRVLHFRLFAKYALAFLNISISSACLASCRYKRAFFYCQFLFGFAAAGFIPGFLAPNVKLGFMKAKLFSSTGHADLLGQTKRLGLELR